MTGERFLDLLMGRLGGRTEATLRATALLEAQHVQENALEGDAFLPWFLIKQDTSLVLSVGTREVVVPSDFIREVEDDDALVVVDSEGIEHTLEKKSLAELRAFWTPEATASVPKNYALVGSNLMIFPLSEKALQLKLRYFAKQALLNDDSVETSWLKYASDLLLARVGYIMSSLHIRDDEKAAEFAGQITAARSRLIAEDQAREEANRSRTMG